MLPQFLNSCRQIWQAHKIIAEDLNRPIIVYDSIRAVLYAANREFFSNACRKLMARTIKTPQHGIRAQMVLKFTNKLKIVETENDNRIDV